MAPSTFLMGSYKPNLKDEYDSSRIAAAENPRYNAGAPSLFTIPEMVATMFCCTEASCWRTIVVSTQCTAPCATVHAAPARPSCHANESSRPLDIFSFAQCCTSCRGRNARHDCNIASFFVAGYSAPYACSRMLSLRLRALRQRVIVLREGIAVARCRTGQKRAPTKRDFASVLHAAR